MFDPHTIKKDFPIFATSLSSGKPLVYLDSAATSQKPQVVIDAISTYYTHDNANVHRGIHELGDRSTRRWHESREMVASFFGAQPQELILTRNTTEALNMVAYAWGEDHVHAGDLLIATQMDHHSNLVPWQELAKRKKAKLELVPVTKEGNIDLSWLERKVKTHGEKCKVVAFPHVSNTLGTITPVEEVVSHVRKYAKKAVVVVDGAQAAPHMPVDFHALNVDFYAVSAHKMLGPMGIGCLLAKKELLSDIKPWIYGGGMIGEVYDEHAAFALDPEDRFTAGTPDVAGTVGWAAACDYLSHLGMNQVANHDSEMTAYTLERLSSVPEVTIVGPRTKRSGSVTFLYRNVHAHDIAQILSSEGVAVRSGHHCTMPLHTHMGWVATTRISFNIYTTKDDIDACVQALTKVKKIFG